MRKLLTHCSCYFLLVMIVMSAIILQSVRILAPQVDHLRPSIEQLFNAETNNGTVTLGKLNATWYGLRPHLLVDDIAIVDDNGSPLLTIDKVDLTLDMLNSLLKWKWVWRQINCDNVAVNIQQLDNNQWHIAGFALKKSNTSWRYSSPAKLFEYTPKVDINNINISLSLFSGKRLHSTIPLLKIENAGDFHRLSASVNIQGRDALSFTMERESGSLEKKYASGFLRFNQFPVDYIIGGFSPDAAGHIVDKTLPTKSSIDASLWFDFSKEDGFGFLGQIFLADIATPNLSHKDATSIPLASHIVGSFHDMQQWSVGLRDVSLGSSHTLKEVLLKKDKQALQLMMPNLPVKPWLNWVVDRFIASKKITHMIDSLAIEGQMNNILLDIDSSQWQKSVLTAYVKEGSVKPYENIPGINNINGYLETQLLTGAINVDTQKLALFPQGLYDAPIVFDQITGQVSWSLNQEKNTVIVNSSNLSSDSQFGRANGYFLLDIPWISGSRPGEFTLHIGLQNSAAQYYPVFTPNRVPKVLRQWLSQSIQKGQVPQAGFIYRGGFSGGDETRSVQLWLDVAQADLKYSDDWPVLQDISGRVLLDNQSVYAQTTQAKLLGEEIGVVDITWAGDQYRELSIQSDTQLSAQAGLALLTQSWLRTKVGDAFDHWVAQGQIKTRIDINVPLFSEQGGTAREPQQSVIVEFTDNNIQLNEQRLRLDDVSGVLRYSQDQGITSEGLSMFLFNQPLVVEIEQKIDESKREYISLSGSSRVDIDTLTQWLEWPDIPALAGVMDYQMSLDIPVDDNQQQYRAKLQVSSDLKQMNSSFPAPFNKSKGEQTAFFLESLINDDITEHKVTLGRTIKANIFQEIQSTSGFISVNKNDVLVKELPKNTLVINAALDKLPVKQWQSIFASIDFASKRSSQPFDFLYSIDVGEFTYNTMSFADMQLSGNKTEKIWRTSINHSQIAGNISFDEDFTSAIDISLDYLHLPKLNQKASPDLEKHVVDLNDLSELKPSTVYIDKFTYNDIVLGSWKFTVNPKEMGLSVENIYGTLDDMLLHGDTVNDGATLTWLTSADKKIRSTFEGRLVGKKVQNLFNYFGFKPLLESKKMDLQANVTWAGSPVDFAIAKLTGHLQVAMQDGLFVQSEGQTTGGVLRLFGLFNFDTWARRLRLDFSDLYKKGIVFDQFDSRFAFDNGDIFFQEPLVVKSPSSSFTMAGKIDYPKEEIDAVLLTTLPVGGNLTFVTALAAGLPAAAGVYIVSKLFKPQVNKVSSLTYSIKGGWSKPNIEFINLFDDKPKYQPEEQAQ